MIVKLESSPILGVKKKTYLKPPRSKPVTGDFRKKLFPKVETTTT